MAPLGISISSLAISTYRNAVSAITYLLKTNFAGVAGQPVTLTHNQALDTTGEGVVTGQLTVYDSTNEASAQIDGDYLVLVGDQAIPDWARLAVYGQGLDRTNGRIMVFTLNKDNASVDMILGFSDRINSYNYTYYMVGVYYSGTVLFNIVSGVWTQLRTGFPINTDHRFAIQVLTTGYRIFAEISGVWTLVYVQLAGSTNPIYPMFSSAPDLGGKIKCKNWGITQDAYPTLVAAIVDDVFTGTENSDVNGRTPTIGPNWLVGTDSQNHGTGGCNVRIKSNIATLVRNFTDGWYSASLWSELTHTDVMLTATIYPGTGCQDNNLFGRYPSMVQGRLNNSANNISIVEGWTVRASTAYSNNPTVGYNCVLSLIGSQVCFTNGFVSVNATVTTLSGTYVGVYFNGLSSGYTYTTRVDNFKAYPTTGYDEILDTI